MKTVYKNGPPSHLMRASSTENYELRTDYFIKFSHSTCCVIIVQPLSPKATYKTAPEGRHLPDTPDTPETPDSKVFLIFIHTAFLTYSINFPSAGEMTSGTAMPSSIYWGGLRGRTLTFPCQVAVMRRLLRVIPRPASTIL